MSESPYMTIDEVAEMLRTPKSSIYSWRVRGEGPPARLVGRRLLFRLDEVVAWVEAQK